MAMTSRFRKLVLAVHVAVSVGWMGAVAAYIPFDLAAATSKDVQMLRAAYLAMGTIVSSVIVPLALAALVTGLAVSLGTRWGLFRHYWVLISFLLTVFAVAVLLVEARTIGYFADMAADPVTSDGDLRALGSTLVHSVGGAGILVSILVLNMYKPSGMTPYGWRKRARPGQSSSSR